MDQLPPLGTAIGEVVGKTFAIYDPIVRANAAAIKSTPTKTFSYGDDPRQCLDVYYPHEDLAASAPLLMFLYGGGLVRGAKTIPGYADGLVHANVGHFFAEERVLDCHC